MNIKSYDCLLIVDFGSQVTQLIARRLREINVYCEIHPYQNLSESLLSLLSPKAIILSGGPDSVTRDGSPRAHPTIFEIGVPLLGICYGQQVMMQQLGMGQATITKIVLYLLRHKELIERNFSVQGSTIHRL